MAWSMGIALSGVFPETGFHGESFAPSTYRFRLKGQQIANNWKKIGIDGKSILFLFEV